MAPSPGMHEMGKKWFSPLFSFISNLCAPLSVVCRILARAALFLADIPHFLLRIWHVDVQISTQFVVSHLAGVNFSSHAAAVWWLTSRAGIPRTIASIHIRLSNFFRHAGYLLAWPKVRWRLGRSDDKDEHILRLQKKIAFLEQRQTPCRSKKGALIAAIGASQSELIGALKYNSENLMHSHFDRMEQHLLQTMESMHSRHEARMGKILGEFAELNDKLSARTPVAPAIYKHADQDTKIPNEHQPMATSLNFPNYDLHPLPPTPNIDPLQKLFTLNDDINLSLCKLNLAVLDIDCKCSGGGWEKLAVAQQDTLAGALGQFADNKRPSKKKTASLQSLPPESPQEDDELAKSRKIIAELRSRDAARAAVEARRNELQMGGRILSTVTIPTGSTAEQYPITDVFVKHVGSSEVLDITEPYLVSCWQMANLSDLLDALVARSFVRTVRLLTHQRSEVSRDALVQLSERLTPIGMQLTIAFAPDLHLRELAYSNGTVISADRGLDIYKAECISGMKRCRNVQIIYYETQSGPFAAKLPLVPPVVSPSVTRSPLGGFLATLPKVAGVIKSIMASKGFGFVSVPCDGSALDLYFRCSTMTAGTTANSMVTVTLDISNNGRPRVARIQPVVARTISKIVRWWKRLVPEKPARRRVYCGG